MVLTESLYTTNFHWIASVLLLTIRLSVVLMMTPVFQSVSAPASVKILLIIGLSIALVSGIPGGRYEGEIGLPQLVLAVIAEGAIGFVLALGIILAFSAFSVAGKLVDVQIGFGMAQIYDPISRGMQPILTSVFDLLALVVFFSMNGHHALMRGLAFSLERIPLGTALGAALFSPATLVALSKQVTAVFLLGFSLVAPIVFCILLIEFGLGVLVRNLQQMNIFVMAMHVKVLVGLIMLSAWSTGMGAVMSRIYATIFHTWDAVLQ